MIEMDPVKKFEIDRPIYETLAKRCEGLLADIMLANRVNVHVIESRAKSIESLSEKINRTGKSYKNPLEEIDDLCGCRIILYYVDDIERVCEIVKNQFKIVSEDRGYQPNNLEVDRFGYISLHLVVTLSDERLKLAEWQAFNGRKIEIQIRTVIQHAWSAVSHALQYKRESSVPSSLKRRLFRIAGLFELADEEFLAIRTQKESLVKIAEELIVKREVEIPLSITTLESFIKSWKDFHQIESVAKSCGFQEGEYEDGVSFIPDIFDILERGKVGTIAELEEAIKLDKLEGLFERLSGIYVRPGSASREFLLFSVLAKSLPSGLVVSDMVKNGWDKALAEKYKAALKP